MFRRMLPLLAVATLALGVTAAPAAGQDPLPQTVSITVALDLPDWNIASAGLIVFQVVDVPVGDGPELTGTDVVSDTLWTDCAPDSEMLLSYGASDGVAQIDWAIDPLEPDTQCDLHTGGAAVFSYVTPPTPPAPPAPPADTDEAPAPARVAPRFTG